MLNIDSLVGFWRGVPKQPPYLHPADAMALVRGGISLERHGVYANLFPQPWVGPIRTARAFLLQLNPGFSGPEVQIEESSQEFRHALKENLDGGLPNLFLDDRFASHPGRRWVEAHLRGVAPIRQLAAQVAQLEIFPYHSKTFDIPGSIKRILLDLPSVRVMQKWAREVLLPAATRNEVAIVVQRSSKIWGFKTNQESDFVIIYRGAECQGGWVTSNTRGGQLITRCLMR